MCRKERRKGDEAMLGGFGDREGGREVCDFTWFENLE